MSEHRPTVDIAIDVFPDAADDPKDIAAMAWATVRRWVADGYLPVMFVTMPDGNTFPVDLEAVAEEDKAVLAASTVKAPSPDGADW